jgi:hypothetical protein
MSLRVFISHSIGEDEIPIVDHLSASLTAAGVPNYLAVYDRQIGVRLSDKVKSQIAESQILVALLTKKGDRSSWVHDEIGYALGKGLRVAALLEKDLELDGMHEGAEYFRFDPADPRADLEALAERLGRERAEQDAAEARAEAVSAQSQADAAVVVAVIALCIALVAIAVLAARE